MDLLLLVISLVISLGSISVCLYLFLKVYQLSRYCEVLGDYILNLINCHNSLCKDCQDAGHENELFKKELLAWQTELVKCHNTLVERVAHITNSWQDDWDNGNEWKRGYRPDGSSTDEED